MLCPLTGDFRTILLEPKSGFPESDFFFGLLDLGFGPNSARGDFYYHRFHQTLTVSGSLWGCVGLLGSRQAFDQVFD